MGQSVSECVDETIQNLGDEALLSRFVSGSVTYTVLNPFTNEQTKPPTVPGGNQIIAVETKSNTGVSYDVGYFESVRENTRGPSLSEFTDACSGVSLSDFTDVEREVMQQLLANTFRLYSPLAPTVDWSRTVYDGNRLISDLSGDIEDDFKISKSHLKRNFAIDGEQREKVFDRFDELLSSHSPGNHQEYANTKSSSRKVRFCGYTQPAKTLYIDSPLVTKTQAVVWALSQFGLSQHSIAHLRGTTQSSVSQTLQSVHQKKMTARMTADAFESADELLSKRTVQSKVDMDSHSDLFTERAERRFELEKSLTTTFAHCPECGRDAGEFEGEIGNGGSWVGEPNKFFEATYDPTPDNAQSPEYPQKTECPDCAFRGSSQTFQKEWEDKHGEIPHREPDAPVPTVGNRLI